MLFNLLHFKLGMMLDEMISCDDQILVSVVVPHLNLKIQMQVGGRRVLFDFCKMPKLPLSSQTWHSLFFGVFKLFHDFI